MKKMILSFAALAFFAATLVSCGGQNEATTETVSTEEAIPTEEVAPETSLAANDVPAFSSEEVNQGLAEYKALLNEYVGALESKDAAKITDLNARAQQVATNAASWGQKLKPEELQRFSEYWQQLANEWATAAQKAAQ